MNTCELWHNPRCSKSRQALALVEEQGVKVEIFRYLDAPPTMKQLGRVLEQLGMEPQALLRTKESVLQTLNLDLEHSSREEWMQAMIENPILIERPIFINGNKAVVGRPPEKVLEII